MLERNFFDLNKEIKLIFDNLGDAVYYIDSHGALLYMNKTAEKLDDLSFEQVKGKTIQELYHLDQQHSPLLWVAANKKPICDHTFRYYVNNQEVYQVCNTYPIQLPDGSWGAFSVQRNVSKIKEAIEKNLELQKQLFYYRDDSQRKEGRGAFYSFDDIIGEHPRLLECKRLAFNAAQSDSPVYFCGFTGTGKELFAQSIHSASERRKGPFLAINCAAIPESLLESLLFGTAKGVYTGATERKGLFERANGGTLFLDEINSMPLASQAKLLRVLEEKYVLPLGGKEKIKIDTRIISGCNVLPKVAIEKRQIREDLFYRLAVINIMIPSLRERKSDIFILAHHFISQYNVKYQKNVLAMDDEIMSFFLEYPWPGNVRQLKYCIECAMNLINADENIIRREHLPYYIQEYRDNPLEGVDEDFHAFTAPVPIEKTIAKTPELQTGNRLRPDGENVLDSIRRREKEAIIAALEQSGGCVSKSAKFLGLSRQTLSYRMKKYGIK